MYYLKKIMAYQHGAAFEPARKKLYKTITATSTR